MSKVYRGKTEDADAAMLGAPFWQVGQKLIGVVLWPFKTEVGDCYTLRLGKPVKVGDREQQVVSVGNLTGFRMALQAAGVDPLLPGDKVVIECTGKQESGKGSDRINFSIEVTRDERDADF